MSLLNFRAYQLSIQFYQKGQNFRCRHHLKEQFDRASSSISLNLSEGSAKPTKRDRLKFYYIALGSLRECQTILDISGVRQTDDLKIIANQMGAQIFVLCRNLEKQITGTQA